MRFDKIVEILCERDPSFVPAVNLFVNKMPAEVTDGVLLMDNGSGTQIDSYINPMRRGRFQAIVRNSDAQEGLRIANKIGTTLSVQEQTDRGDVRIFFIRQTAEPIPYPTAVSGLYEHSVNFLTLYAIIG